jgi:hypothetical protein
MFSIVARQGVRPLRRCLFSLLILTAVAGCGLALRSHADRAYANFDRALHECRMQQPGRLNRKLNLPPTSLGVSRCLKQYGWTSSGEPIGELAQDD